MTRSLPTALATALWLVTSNASAAPTVAPTQPTQKEAAPAGLEIEGEAAEARTVGIARAAVEALRSAGLRGVSGQLARALDEATLRGQSREARYRMVQGGRAGELTRYDHRGGTRTPAATIHAEEIDGAGFSVRVDRAVETLGSDALEIVSNGRLIKVTRQGFDRAGQAVVEHKEIKLPMGDAGRARVLRVRHLPARGFERARAERHTSYRRLPARAR